MADNWVSPTGHNDPDSEWTDEASAYDGNTATYAQGSANHNLEFTIDAIQCNQVRFYTYGGFSFIDVYYDGDWHEVNATAHVMAEWVTCADFGTQSVTAARVRFTSGLYRIGEFEFNEVPPTPPTVSLSPATAVTDTTATVNGTVTDDGNLECEGRFRYRKVGTEAWTTTEWAGALGTDDPFSENLVGLEPYTAYEYQAQAQNTEGASDWTASEAFTTVPTVTPYVGLPYRVEVRDVDGHLIAIPRAVFSGQLTRSLNMPDGLSFQIAADDPACKYMTPRYELWVRDLSTGEIVSVCKTVMTEASDQ